MIKEQTDMDRPVNEDAIANAFRNPDVPTLAQVRDRIARDGKLDPIRRRDVCSALNAMASAAGGTPEQICADFAMLRKRTADFHPAHARISRKRWQNIRSDVAFAFRHLGLNRSASRHLAPFRYSWKRLTAVIQDKQLRWHLSRLFHLCSALGLDPEDVNENVKEHLRTALLTEGKIKDPDLLVRRTISLWNKAARTVPGWPTFQFEIVDRRDHYTTPIEQFPETFQADLARFLNRVGSSDPFRRDAPRRPFAPATLEHRKDQIRRVASALVLSGTPISQIGSLAEIVAPDALTQALTFLWRRSDENMTANIHGVAVAMLSIARHHVRLDGSSIERIQNLVEQCNPRETGLTEKNMARLRQFLDERNVALLLGLPERLAATAQRRESRDEKAAILMQSAVGIELLLMTMVRRKNLVSLNEEFHVKWSQSGRRGICHIAFDGAEVKNGTPLHFELPARSARLLRLYLQEYQPVLRSAPNPWLFPGHDGTGPKNAAGMTMQITGTVFEFTGIRMHVHLFRHVGALLYLKRNPGGYEVLRRVFGHRTLATTIAAYCGLEALFNAQHFDDEILAHSDTLRRRYREASRARSRRRAK